MECIIKKTFEGSLKEFEEECYRYYILATALKGYMVPDVEREDFFKVEYRALYGLEKIDVHRDESYIYCEVIEDLFIKENESHMPAISILEWMVNCPIIRILEWRPYGEDKFLVFYNILKYREEFDEI